MNKRGFIRIVEATVSIILIIGVLFFYFTQDRVIAEQDLSERARDILEEVSKDTSMREDILGYDTRGRALQQIPGDIDTFVGSRIPENYLDFEIRICDIETSCGQSSFEGNVYSAERSISSTLNTLPVEGPRKIRLFIWEIEG